MRSFWPVVVALQQATRTVPIVFAMVADPVGAGFVDRLPSLRPVDDAAGPTVQSAFRIDIDARRTGLSGRPQPAYSSCCGRMSFKRVCRRINKASQHPSELRANDSLQAHHFTIS